MISQNVQAMRRPNVLVRGLKLLVLMLRMGTGGPLPVIREEWSIVLRLGTSPSGLRAANFDFSFRQVGNIATVSQSREPRRAPTTLRLP